MSSSGLAILIHGWEGSADSSYVLRTGRMFFETGYDVLRINLRDHGETHRLNRHLFNGSLLDEVHNVACLAAKQYIESKPVKQRKSLPVFLAGFSLGGNYTIRLTRLHNETKRKITNLKHSFAISPALDPYDATVRMDEHPILGKYFFRKWISSLEKKQKYFPALYDFAPMKKAKDVMDLTDRVLEKYSKFNHVKEYFSTYTLDPQSIRKIKTPLTILTAADDPIITVDHFEEIKNSNPPKNVEILIAPHGGHNGFYYNTSMHCLYEDLIANRLKL